MDRLIWTFSGLLLIVGQIQAECLDRYFELNGLCLEQTSTCAVGHVLIKGTCYLAKANSTCKSDEVFVHAQCCSEECINQCQKSNQCCSCCDLPKTSTCTESCDIPKPPVCPPVPDCSLLATTPPPEPLTECPKGSILINNACRLIYCDHGIYQNGKCVEVTCPDGFIWFNSSCMPPQPNEYEQIIRKTEVIYNHTEPEIIINGGNIVKVNLTRPAINTAPTQKDTECNAEYDECESQIKHKCCIVKTPRICKPGSNGNRWYCYSRRYKRCGEMCIAPTIYLKPSKCHQMSDGFVIPPQVINSDSNLDLNNFDCSGCYMENIERCASYCYNYDCNIKKHCQFVDQRQYCEQFPGEMGCFAKDGCIDEWCSR